MEAKKHQLEIHSSQRANWIKKYLLASCDAEKEFLKIHAETSLSRIWQHITNPDRVVGFISGFVNMDCETDEVLEPSLPIEKQLKNLNALIADVKSLGFGYSVVEGSYEGQKERSLVIYGKREDSAKLLNFLKSASAGKTPQLSKIENPKFWQQSFIFKSEDSTVGLLYVRSKEGVWDSGSIGEFSTKGIEDIYSKLLKKGQRWKKEFDDKNSNKKFRFACAWVGISNKSKYFNDTIATYPRSILISALKKCVSERKNLREKIIAQAKAGKHSALYASFDVEAAGVYRVIQIANKKPYVIISASRKQFSAAENKKRSEQLLKEIKEYDLYAYQMIGGYEEEQPDGTKTQVIESSFFVPYNDTDLNNFIGIFKKLMIKYDQQSILVGLPENYDYGAWEPTIEGLDKGGHYFVYTNETAEKIGTKATIQTFDKYGSIAIDPHKNRAIDWVIAGITTPSDSSGCFVMNRAGLKWFWDSFKKPEIDTNNETIKNALQRFCK